MESVFSTVVVASDHAAVEFKADIINHLKSLNVTVIDVGTHSTDSCDYPDYAHDACEKIQTNEAQAGVLVCGSGIGISIAANKHKGIRAALCHDYYTAKMCREHNDANIICMGARTTGIEVAKQMVEVWLTTPFCTENPNHARRLEKISQLENSN